MRGSEVAPSRITSIAPSEEKCVDLRDNPKQRT